MSRVANLSQCRPIVLTSFEWLLYLTFCFQYKTARSSELKQILEKARRRAEELNDKDEVRQWIAALHVSRCEAGMSRCMNNANYSIRRYTRAYITLCHATTMNLRKKKRYYGRWNKIHDILPPWFPPWKIYQSKKHRRNHFISPCTACDDIVIVYRASRSNMHAKGF